MKDVIKNIVRDQFYISLMIAVFLLLQTAFGVFAAEMVLSPSVSVTIPEGQSGNPGEFITYILQLSNRSSKPLNLQVEYLSGRRWSVLGEVTVSLPAHTSNHYFPVTVLIPQDAPAGLEENIRIRFKPEGASFALPEVMLGTRVNSVSAIHFATPALGGGIPGSQVTYEITVTNTGNTDEHFRIEYRSANGWSVEVDPVAFSLSPGQTRIIRIIQRIPGYPTVASDQLELMFHWDHDQKLINLTTYVTDKLDALSSQYYIWQGELRLGQSDQTASGELAVNGQLGPDHRASLYASEQTWFANLQSDAWDLKTGKFPLSWPGLITPATGHAHLLMTQRSGDRVLTFSNWSAANHSDSDIWGVEAALNHQSSLRWLHDPTPDDPDNIMEWHYQNALNPTTFWSNAFSVNAGDSSSYAGGFTLAGQPGNWQWNTSFQYLQNFQDIRKKQSFGVTIGLPQLAEGRRSGYLQLQYEGKQLNEDAGGITDYDDYQWQVTANLSTGLRVYLAHSYHWVNAALDHDSFSGGLGLSHQAGRFNHEANLSFSTDNDRTEGSSSYHWLDWYSRYTLSPIEALIVNPNFDSDRSRFGIGYQRRLSLGAEISTLFYPYFRPSSQSDWTLILSWPFEQYLLAFKYTGVWQSGDYATDSYSLNLNRRFSFPVKKPLSALTGMAFIDTNRNSLREPQEATVGRLDLLLDERTPFQSDAAGIFNLTGLTPGEHRLALDSRYNVIYTLPDSAARITAKPYQTITVNLPLIRTRNLTGLVFQDKDADRRRDPAKYGLAGIPLSLTDLLTGETHRAYTDSHGQFVFYQLAPIPYQLTIDATCLPEAWQLPQDFQPFLIDANALAEQTEIRIGLIPYEKPIELIPLPTPLLTLMLDREYVYSGDTVQITVQAGREVTQISLMLPDGSRVRLDPSERDWTLQWRIPREIPPGQYSIRCTASTDSGATVEAECILTVL